MISDWFESNREGSPSHIELVYSFIQIKVCIILDGYESKLKNSILYNATRFAKTYVS